ncbi:stage II sporulation protein P [Clostridiaceae bacterium 35-E11]
MKIKVIEIKKYYKWISICLTCIMCILSFRVLILDTKDMIVKANGAGKTQKFVQADKEKNISNDLLILMMNKTIPAMEVKYKEENGYSSYREVIKLALGKLINFDYEDPKTLLKAQISMLNETDDDLAELNDYVIPENTGLQNENTKNQEIHYVEDVTVNHGTNEDVTSEKEVPASSNVQKENTEAEKQSTNIEEPQRPIEIVSSPIKMPDKVKLDMKEPTIFIYHTHGTESYMPEEVGNFHSLNRKYTVRAVGDVLSQQLTAKGYKVIHDDTLHDYPSYQQSYVRALETLQSNLKKNRSLKIVFDIHRDAAPENDTARENSFVVIDNKKVARFSIVIGTQNPNAAQLNTFAEYIKAKSDELYPGLAKKIIKKGFKFNQYNSDYYALIEVGNTANYIEEALKTSEYLARILDEVVKDIKE